MKTINDRSELDDLEVGEEFWDGSTGIKMLKFDDHKFSIVLDENGNVINKPVEH